MSIISRLRRWTRPTPPRRLRFMYWTMSAAAAVLLCMLHVALTGEQHLAQKLTRETRAALAAPRVLIVRVPSPAPRAAKTVHNIRRAPQPAHKE